MALTIAARESKAANRVGTFRLEKYGAGALVAVCLVTVLILFVSISMIEFPSEFIGGPFGPIAVGPVVINSAVAAVGATVVYGIVKRYTVRPNRTFGYVAAGILVLSFAMFLVPDLAGAPLELFAVLALMHCAAALVIVGVLTRAKTEVSSR